MSLDSVAGLSLLRHVTRATFYIWLDLSGLEEPINNGLVFFEELLKVRLVSVAGDLC